MRTNRLRSCLWNKPVLLVAMLLGLQSGAYAQSSETPAGPRDQFEAVSMDAQRLIFQLAQREGERAKDIARKRPIRKMVGQFGFDIDYKAPAPKPSSARRMVIGRSQSHVPSIP